MSEISFHTNISGLLDAVFSETANRQAFLLTDKNVFERVLTKHKNTLLPAKIKIVEAGEVSKSLERTQDILSWLLNHQADRNAVLICLGGGMITDLGGFAASIYKRGIAAFYVPTTLLAMCDATIGGKTGVNLQDSKNQVGTFTQPERIFVSRQFLDTLPEEELKAGWAEVIKHFLIADKSSFDKLGSTLSENNVTNALIQHAIAIKSHIVDSDPFEKHERKILNFGHTVGHAIESFAMHNLKQAISHGYAVSQGMLTETRLSEEICGLPKQQATQIISKLTAYFPKYHFSKADIPAVLEFMLSDKKNRDGRIMASLLSETGKAIPEVALTEQQIIDALEWYVDFNF